MSVATCCWLCGAELVSFAFNEFTGVCSDTMGSSVGLDRVEFGTMGADMVEDNQWIRLGSSVPRSSVLVPISKQSAQQWDSTLVPTPAVHSPHHALQTTT